MGVDSFLVKFVHLVVMPIQLMVEDIIVRKTEEFVQKSAQESASK